MAKAKKSNKPSSTVGVNKKARFEYFIDEKFEAGLVLEGWEVKSLREGKLNITESYVILKDGEAFLLGANIAPLLTASTHINPDPTRTRKLLLHRKQLSTILGAVSRQGFTCVALSIYWSRGRAKCEIALAKGKQKHDKRETQKQQDWKRDKQRILRNANR